MGKMCIYMLIILMFMTRELRCQFNKTKAGLDIEPAVIIETVTRAPYCDKNLISNDTGIFDIDIYYHTGDTLIQSHAGKEKEPRTIRLGKNQILKALETAMIGMCPGEYRKITVPANHAYGNKVIKIPDGRRLNPPVTIIAHATLIQIFRQTQKEIDSAFNIWDTDSDDRLNKKELLNIFEVLTQLVGKDSTGNIDTMLDQWFGVLDADHNGFITKDEFTKAEKTTKNGTEKKLDVEIEKLSQVEKCEKFVKPTDIVILDMEIWYKVDAIVENSRSKDEVKMPYTVKLGDKKMLPALEESIIGMCVNEHRKITVPPHRAYGDKTIKFKDGRILQGESTIIIEVKVIQILRTTEQEMRNFFQLLDADDNKEIDQEELQAVIELFVGAIDEDQTDKMKLLLSSAFKNFDRDENDVISEEEFYNAEQDTKGFHSEDLLKTLLQQMMKTYSKHIQGAQSDAPCPSCPETVEDCPPPPTCDEEPSTCSGSPAKTSENAKVEKSKTNVLKEKHKKSKSNKEKKDSKKTEAHKQKDEL
ncbi:FKBP14 [Mytilus coruscus]|uniref:peptidylprolyl isomerase n=1 Tax=Mytilus coruscus TaxID=42192 RepID=A0A6J8B2A6_MYTCO|nr:FKBP14 [Mytilus coruscus]